MRTLFRSLAMAFSMFSKIPVPMVEWKKENMKYMLCALPLVGVSSEPFCAFGTHCANGLIWEPFYMRQA